jgi:hypothetical protein
LFSPRPLRLGVSKLERWAGLLAVLNIAVVAILLGRPSFSNASRPVRGIANPVLAMELVRNAAEVDTILSDAPSPDREAMRIKEYAGFAFTGCYAALVVVMGMMLAREGRALAIAAGSFGLLAAVCGAVGNLGILRVVDVDLRHTTQALIDAVRYPNLIKWALVTCSLGLFGILLPRKPGVAFRIVGAVEMLAALLALLGLFSNHILAWTGIPMLVGFLGLAILYFRPF